MLRCLGWWAPHFQPPFKMPNLDLSQFKQPGRKFGVLERWASAELIGSESSIFSELREDVGYLEVMLGLSKYFRHARRQREKGVQSGTLESLAIVTIPAAVHDSGERLSTMFSS
jgi:hypothetical protein